MTALLLSWVCDHCDGFDLHGSYERGYVVWRDRGPASQEFVFRTREDAERWRAYMGVEDLPIKTVLTEWGFRWRKSRGSITDVELADHLIEIYPDHRFEPGPHRAFLAPEKNAA